ncbi:MAG: TolC family protein [Bacteroidales bacterium]|nr:TolC family protein [Bacteroidales bacterium]
MKYLKRKYLLMATLLSLFWPGIDVISQTLITLERSIEIAGVNSPDMKRSMLNLERYDETLKAQRASLKSKFYLNVAPITYSQTRDFDNRFSSWYTNDIIESYGTLRIDQPILPTDGTISLVNRFGWQKSTSDYQGEVTKNQAFTNNLSLVYNQPLFTYNRTKLELQEIELDYENAYISYSLQKLNLEKNVTQFFYNVYMAKLNLEISTSELENTQHSYEIIKNKVDAGLAAMEELYQAEVNLATAKSSLQNNEVSLANAKDEFIRFLGMDLYEEISIMGDISEKPVSVNLAKAVEHGLNSRMELRQREIDIETSQFQLIRTKSLTEFRGDVQLSIGIFGENEKLSNIYENPTSSPRVAIAFNIPIFDWGEKKARIKAQEAVIASTELNYDEQRKQIIIDIRKVYRNLLNQQNQIEIARQNEKNAQLTYEINLERYQNGDLTGMDLNLYQTQLSEKKIAYAQTLINYKIELLNMKIQSLYDFETDSPIIPAELFENIVQ